MKYITTVNNKTFTVEINREGELIINDEIRKIDFHQNESNSIVSLIIDNQSYEVIVEEHEDNYQVMITGDLYEVAVTDEREQRLARATGGLVSAAGEIAIKSPMPGLIVDVPVAVGEEVTAGQTVVVLESMKMQNELKSPRDGVIDRITVKPGQNVEQNKLLVAIN